MSDLTVRKERDAKGSVYVCACACVHAHMCVLCMQEPWVQALAPGDSQALSGEMLSNTGYGPKSKKEGKKEQGQREAGELFIVESFIRNQKSGAGLRAYFLSLCWIMTARSHMNGERP